MLEITHTFDVALAVRGRRKQFKLRQSEVARHVGVSREWLIDLEHGKPTAELAKVLSTCQALGIRLEVLMTRQPPAWTLPLTAEAETRRTHLAAHRPPRRQRKGVAIPEDYPWKTQLRQVMKGQEI